MSNEPVLGIDLNEFKEIIDLAYDEIFIYDANYKVVYVNRACERHYGMKPEQLMGKEFWALANDDCWFPSVLPKVYEEKRRITIKQTSYLGVHITTTAVPVLDEKGDIRFVVMSVRDQMFELDLIREQMEKEWTLDSSEAKVEKEKKTRLIHRSPEMNAILLMVERIAKVDSTILIQGESGTGKGVMSRVIHEKSKRNERAFLTINCAAIPEDLLESELFGYTEGAFTGAKKGGKQGLIEMAHKGTLFLDEIGELSMRLQSKLLHVIQEREFIPVGGREAKTVDVRIIAATNRKLIEMVKEKGFREDLYYRLNVLELEIPPIREREEDILALSQYYLNHFNHKYERNCVMSEDLRHFFLGYKWPGNVRQLENTIERLVLTANEDKLLVEDLPRRFQRDEDRKLSVAKNYEDAKTLFEIELVGQLYSQFDSSRKLADRLGVSQTKASRMIRTWKQHQNKI